MRGYPEHLHEVINEDLQESIYDETLEKMEDVKECRHTREEIEEFIAGLNFKIQYLGLNKDEVIKIVESLYN